MIKGGPKRNLLKKNAVFYFSFLKNVWVSQVQEMGRKWHHVAAALAVACAATAAATVAAAADRGLWSAAAAAVAEEGEEASHLRKVANFLWRSGGENSYHHVWPVINGYKKTLLDLELVLSSRIN